MHTYDSDAFLASVLRNLPSPENSGPKTPEGKYIVSCNAVTHGLRLPPEKLLPCKRKCFYKDTCEWHEMIFGDNKDKYAGPCPYEVALFTMLDERLTEENPDLPDELKRDYIDLTIAINRCNRYIGLHPEIKGTVRGYSYVHIVKDWHLQKLIDITKQMQEYYQDEPE